MGFWDEAGAFAQDALSNATGDGGAATPEGLAGALTQVMAAHNEANQITWQVKSANDTYEAIEVGLFIEAILAIEIIQAYQHAAIEGGFVATTADGEEDDAVVLPSIHHGEQLAKAQILSKRDQVVKQLNDARNGALKAISDALGEALRAIENAKETDRRLLGILEEWEKALLGIFD